MEFGRVLGRARLGGHCADGQVIIEVTLETSRSTAIARSECVPMLDPPQGKESLRWQAEQYTQETIGTTLAESGWEAFSEGQEAHDRGPTDLSMVTYIVRRVL
ncbi:hypothetical protein BH23CHL5_BH23CHL5_12490 [soil metagenome]